MLLLEQPREDPALIFLQLKPRFAVLMTPSRACRLRDAGPAFTVFLRKMLQDPSTSLSYLEK